jgi:dephospho-CoA kinase
MRLSILPLNGILNNGFRKKAFPIVVYEAAILFESGNYKDFDSIITVTAPLESRIQRVIERDKTTRDQILGRINSQWTDEQRVLKVMLL